MHVAVFLSLVSVLMACSDDAEFKSRNKKNDVNQPLSADSGGTDPSFEDEFVDAGNGDGDAGQGNPFAEAADENDLDDPLAGGTEPVGGATTTPGADSTQMPPGTVNAYPPAFTPGGGSPIPTSNFVLNVSHWNGDSDYKNCLEYNTDNSENYNRLGCNRDEAFPTSPVVIPITAGSLPFRVRVFTQTSPNSAGFYSHADGVRMEKFCTKEISATPEKRAVILAFEDYTDGDYNDLRVKLEYPPQQVQFPSLNPCSNSVYFSATELTP